MYVTESSAQANFDNSLNNEDLMISYSLGNAEAFEELYHRNKAPLYRYFLRQLDQAALAEEFAHEVWLRVIKSRESYLPTAKFTTYLFQIAHNHLVDHFRKTSKVREVDIEDNEDEVQNVFDASDPGAVIDKEKCRALLLSLIKELPEEQREVFLLKEEGNLSIEEIAQVVHENIETVKSRMRYALKKLKNGMQPFVGR
ncbi:sigma-70 family RNA polymerase sigma factor [Kaarinaea lacus]